MLWIDNWILLLNKIATAITFSTWYLESVKGYLVQILKEGLWVFEGKEGMEGVET